MRVRLSLIRRENPQVEHSGKEFIVSEAQYGALIDKMEALKQDADSKYDLRVKADRCFNNTGVGLYTIPADNVSKDIDNWIEWCEKPKACRSGRCRMGVILK